MHEVLIQVAKFYKNHAVLAWSLSALLFIFSAGTVLIPLFFLGIAIGTYYLVYLLKTYKYYQSEDFQAIKQKLTDKIAEYNEFDHFMDETREFIRKKQLHLTNGNVRNSTLTVYKNSQLDMHKYIVKYFFINTKIDEDTLQTIEAILQKYNTINKTYEILSDEYKELIDYVNKHMYRGAYIFMGLTMKKLGSRKLPKFERDYYMWYAFDYSSPTNRKHYRNSLVLDESRLEKFAQYLNSIIAFRKSAKYQRQLMTPQLREFILSRAKFTCRYCGVSRENERHLLLEVDHIMPISKGGITVEQNLQSLCWKCNRSKGSKVDQVSQVANQATY